MSQINGYREYTKEDISGNEIPAAEPQMFNPMNFANLFSGMFANNTYPMIWNQYVNFLLQGQEVFSRLSMGVLQFYGVATGEDIARLNRQLFEAYHRIDELENKLGELESAKK
jgi:hypothetical protein